MASTVLPAFGERPHAPRQALVDGGNITVDAGAGGARNLLPGILRVDVD